MRLDLNEDKELATLGRWRRDPRHWKQQGLRPQDRTVLGLWRRGKIGVVAR